MRVRRLGRLGLGVSECTIGTARLAAPGSDRSEAEAMVAMALDRGVNAFEIDAGDGEAVRLLGDVFERESAASRVHVFARVTSRVPFALPSPHVPVQQAYPGSHIRAEAEALLARLGVERLGLLQLHAWCPEWLHEGNWLETMARLRDEGKIAGCGVSLFDHDAEAGLEAVAGGAIDAVQAMYNLFDPSPAAALLPLCGERDVGVIARAPLYFGALAGPVRRYPPGDWRADYFFEEHRRETSARVEKLARETGVGGGAVSTLALRFSLSHPAVTTVAVGMCTRAQLEANLQALSEGPLDADLHAALAAYKWLC